MKLYLLWEYNGRYGHDDQDNLLGIYIHRVNVDERMAIEQKRIDEQNLYELESMKSSLYVQEEDTKDELPVSQA